LVKPYKQNGDIRTFSSKISESELVWHRDKEDRLVEVLEGFGWKFQYDDCLPFELILNDKVLIEKMRYHRILKGITDLKIKIVR
jgi:hypothetical protein